MNVKIVTISLVIIFIASVPEGDSFTAGAGFFSKTRPKTNTGKKSTVIYLKYDT